MTRDTAAYEIQKNFFAGKREPGKTDWDRGCASYHVRGFENKANAAEKFVSVVNTPA